MKTFILFFRNYGGKLYRHFLFFSTQINRVNDKQNTTMNDKVIFSSIPNFSRFVVSNDGNLYKRIDGKLKQLKNSVNYNGYVCNYLTDDSGKRRYM